MPDAPLLQTVGLTAYYGDFQALFGIDVTVAEGETVAIIGANGAGKSTFLKSVAGLLRSGHDAIRFKADPIGDLPAFRVVALGIAMVPEGQRLFPSLSVEENLLLGGYIKRPGPWSLGRVYELFPVLRERRRNPGTALSGGQQQMVAIGRALLCNPQLLLCDEISLGLAPVVIRDIYAALPAITGGGTSVVVVEQDIGQALAVAERVYCLQEGHVTLEGRPAELTREQISRAYFGIHA
jgi:branched-chain amino acid transport system ATP-binding protein